MLTSAKCRVEHLQGMTADRYGSMKAMPLTPDGFEWVVPARVLAVLSGDVFLADADLGFDVHSHVYVQVAGIHAPDDLPARKEAQRLLANADVILSCRGRVKGRWLCDVAYGPYFQPRSEQASFAAAMLASGHAVPVMETAR